MSAPTETPAPASERRSGSTRRKSSPSRPASRPAPKRRRRPPATATPGPTSTKTSARSLGSIYKGLSKGHEYATLALESLCENLTTDGDEGFDVMCLVAALSQIRSSLCDLESTIKGQEAGQGTDGKDGEQ
jgi:hypothetical protein